jgi:hypothetical protein
MMARRRADSRLWHCVGAACVQTSRVLWRGITAPTRVAAEGPGLWYLVGEVPTEGATLASRALRSDFPRIGYKATIWDLVRVAHGQSEVGYRLTFVSEGLLGSVPYTLVMRYRLHKRVEPLESTANPADPSACEAAVTDLLARAGLAINDAIA